MAQLHPASSGPDDLAVFVADAHEPGNPIVHVDQGFEQATGFSLDMLRGLSWTTLCIDAEAAARSLADESPAPVAMLTAGACSRRLVTPFLVKAVRDGRGLVTAVIGVSATQADLRRVAAPHREPVDHAA